MGGISGTGNIYYKRKNERKSHLSTLIDPGKRLFRSWKLNGKVSVSVCDNISKRWRGRMGGSSGTGTINSN